mgnify:CR=1 FL=1
MIKQVGQWRVETPNGTYTITQRYFGDGFVIISTHMGNGGAVSHFADALECIARWESLQLSELSVINIE